MYGSLLRKNRSNLKVSVLLWLKYRDGKVYLAYRLVLSQLEASYQSVAELKKKGIETGCINSNKKGKKKKKKPKKKKKKRELYKS